MKIPDTITAKVREFREKVFEDKVFIKDPNTPTV